MKLVHFIAPAIALVIAWCLVGAQWQEIARLEKMTDVLKKHIAADVTRIGAQRTVATLSRLKKPEIAKDGIDWREIAGLMNRGGGGDVQKMSTLSRKLDKMDKDQLLAALDEIQTLELGEEERMMLEVELIDRLALKDPELVLNRFFDRIGDENMKRGFALAKALGEWTQKDPTAAIAWFDKTIADGAFDSKSMDVENTFPIRNFFEMNLISKLISADPAIAQVRISALSAAHRAQVLNIFDLENSKGQVTHANLVRENLSAEEASKIFGNQASMIAATEGLGKVDAYLESIGANEKERNVATEKAAMSYLYSQTQKSEVTVELIDSMRQRVGIQAPVSVDRFTGAALGKITANGSMKYSQAADMLMKYHTQGGGDDLLTSFLYNNSTGNHKEEARKIAEKISDPEKREELLNNLK